MVSKTGLDIVRRAFDATTFPTTIAGFEGRAGAWRIAEQFLQ